MWFMKSLLARREKKCLINLSEIKFNDNKQPCIDFILMHGCFMSLE